MQFYQKIKLEAETQLSDATNHKPHYSLRSLCRALEYTRLMLDSFGLEKALFEGISASFLTQLDNPSMAKMSLLIEQFFGK